jgi:sigma-E factor negative regulatory protein RseB
MKFAVAAACISIAAVFIPAIAWSQATQTIQQQNVHSPKTSTTSTKLSGSQWLIKMANSIQQLNYQISLVVNRPSADTVPFLWRHGVFDNGVTMEQLNILNGPGKEYIRVNRVISVFEPDATPYSLMSNLIDGPIPSQLLLSPLALQAGYEFIAVGRGRVSGRVAQQIRIISRDNTRYSYQLWVDEETGIPLKLNMLDLKGQLVKQVQVSQLQVTEQPDPYFSRINHAMLPAVSTPTKTSHQHGWRVAYLPAGMREVKRNTHRLAVTGQVVEYAMLSDGLVEISIYVMPSASEDMQNNLYRHESKTLLTIVEGDVQVTVIGEIPPQTANKIATSLSTGMP